MRSARSHAFDAREVALDLLEATLRHRLPLDEAFDVHPALMHLELRDRAFTLNVATTTIRRLGQIDDLIDHCLSRPLSSKARRIQNLLRLGVCQLVFLRTPPHAAVHTTVALARGQRLQPFAALINAVLRRLAGEGRHLVEIQDAPRLNTPDWLWRSWIAAYGVDACRAIAEAHLREPPLDITPKHRDGALAAELGAVRLPTGTLRLKHRGPITMLPGYDVGAWWVQDAAAALPAKLLGDVRGRRVLDLCAAPGGKTAQLAAAGARVTAVDRAKDRLSRLRQNLKRLGLTAEVVAADATVWRPTEPADAVIVDAPCSATGAIRRHPDAAWLKTPADVTKLAELQVRLMRAAIEMVKPGGLVVYCACSLQPEEGPDRIATLLEGGAPVRRVPIVAQEVGGLAEILTRDGDLRSLPFHMAELGGMDGFYAVRLLRT